MTLVGASALMMLVIAGALVAFVSADALADGVRKRTAAPVN